MDFKGKTKTEQTEELTAAIFAEYLFGPDNFSLQLRDQADSADVLISSRIRTQVVRAGSGENYHRNNALNTRSFSQKDSGKTAPAKQGGLPPIALTEVSPVYQVCLAIEHKVRDKNYSDADKLVLLVLCEMTGKAFSQVEAFKRKITSCIYSNFSGKKLFKEIWAVHRSQTPIRVVKLYP